MNAQNKHLKKHHDTWVYSRRVPSAIAHLYKGSHITFSLKTSSVKVARLKRDKFNGHLANQMQGTISPEREEFKRHLTVAKEYAEAIKDRSSNLTYDDFFPREPIAHAAYREVAYKDTNHIYSYTAKEALQSLLGRKTKLSDDTKQKLQSALDRFLTFVGVNVTCSNRFTHPVKR